jgi:serine/threonine-protein kinase
MTNEPSAADELERFGPYVVLRPIRKGGMGVLALAFDTGAGKPVVLKRLPSKGDASRDRFLDEIKLSQAMDHPNLARTVNAGAIDGQDFLAVEWIAGPDLERLLEMAGKWNMPVPVPVAASIAWQVLQGLAHLHERGCIHRDVGAANIMVDYDGVAHLIDYGVAKFEGKKSQTVIGAVVGTRGFIAPELDEQKPATERSDLYALAASLWFLLTGLRFYEHGVDNNGKDVLAYKLSERGRTDVPRELVTFLWRGLHCSPSARYESAADAARALEKALTLASVNDVAEFLGVLFAADKKLAAEQLADWKRKYAPPASTAPPTAIMRRVELTAPTRTSDNGRSTMVIDRSGRAPRSLLVGAGIAGVVILLVSALGVRWVMRRSAPPAAASAPPALAPPVVVAPPPPPVPAAVEPAAPAPVAPSSTALPKPAAPSSGMPAAIRKRLNEASAWAGMGRTKAAREIYIELERDAHARPQALVGLAQLAYTDGNYSEAARLASRAARAGAGPDALMVRGSAYLALREAEKAEADFAAVLAQQPKNRDAAEGRKMAAEIKRNLP